jgi:hypothetical protein
VRGGSPAKLTTNRGVNDCLKIATSVSIVENKATNGCAIHLAVFVNDTDSEPFANRIENRTALRLDETRDLVSRLHSSAKFVEAGAHGRFPGGNTARYGD